MYTTHRIFAACIRPQAGRRRGGGAWPLSRDKVCSVLKNPSESKGKDIGPRPAGADGVMSAESLLEDPALFSEERREAGGGEAHLEGCRLLLEYAELWEKHPVPGRMVRGHAYKMLGQHPPPSQTCCLFLQVRTQDRAPKGRVCITVGKYTLWRAAWCTTTAAILDEPSFSLSSLQSTASTIS